jgi:hypothetical protein
MERCRSRLPAHDSSLPRATFKSMYIGLVTTFVIDGVAIRSPQFTVTHGNSARRHRPQCRRACSRPLLTAMVSRGGSHALRRRPCDRNVRGRISRGVPVREAGVAHVCLVRLPLVLTKDIDLLEAPGTQVAPGAARQVASLALDLSAKVRV